MERARNPDPELLSTHLAERERLYRSAPLTLYGLPASFQGPRALGESAVVEEDGGTIVEYLGLAHGGPGEQQPRVDVISALETAAPDPVDVLAAEADAVLPPGSGPKDTLEGLLASGGELRRITAQLMLDGEAVAASGLEAGWSWVLQGHHRGQVITVVGSNYSSDGVVLERVNDLEPYLAGTRRALGR
jgi:hypothetical protein